MQMEKKITRILYVEDNSADADLTRRELLRTAPDISLEVVASREEALALLAERTSKGEPFDMVLTDLWLPGASGIELLDDVRRQDMDLPVVVITGSGDEQAAVSALKAGAEDYITKRDGYLQCLPQVLRHALDRFREATARRNRALHVLYAEHNAADIDLTLRHLKRYAPHIHIEDVHSGEEILKRLAARSRRLDRASGSSETRDDSVRSYDVLLLDFRLPGLSALELLKELYQVRKTEIPTVLTTGHGDEEVAVLALKLGAYDYIVKNPGYLHRLPGALENAFYRARLSKEQRALHQSQSQLKENEGKHRRLVQEFHTILDAIPDGISLHSKDLQILWANREARSVENGTLLDLTGQKCFDVYKCKPYLQDDCPVLTSFQSGEPAVQEMNTSTGATWDVRAIPIKNEDGNIESVVRISRNITGQVRLEQKLRQAYKMEAIGTLAGGIAHDFNNVLSIIMGFTEVTLLELPEESPIRANLQDVLKAAFRAKELVRQILTFSRQTEQERRSVQVHLILKEALKLLRSSLPTTIEIRQDIQTKSEVLADPTQLHQILMNLGANAGYAMRETGGVLSVSLSDVELGPECLFIDPQLKPGPYLQLVVGDTGHGMDVGTSERIFEPYFTTKSTEEGTGLGLAVVHGIVKSHDGAVTVKSEPGKGATFTIFLPRIEPVQEDKTIRTEHTPSVPGGKERILLVDDEKALAEMATSMLQRLGYSVVHCTQGEKALQIFESNPDDFDLVITDLSMPKMTGVALAEAMLSKRPNLPILVCTGFTPEASGMLQRAKSIGIHDFLLKPVDLRTLAERVRKALSSE